MSKEIMLDANESAFFRRELEFVKRQSYDTKYRALKAMQLLPVDTSSDPGALEITYQRYSKIGIAKIISDYAMDVPRSDVYGEEVSTKVYRVGSSYGYDRDEIRRSMMAGKSLDQRRADSTKRASDEKINDIAWNGDASYRIHGFLDYPGVTREDSAGTFTSSTTLTPDQIVDQLNEWVNGVIDRTNGLEMPVVMLLPIEQHRYLSTKRIGDSAGTQDTIMSFFLRTNGVIKMIDWLPSELRGAGRGGTDRGVIYPMDPRNLTLELPLPYQQLPPMMKGYGYEILTETKTAGVIVYYPLSVAYLDGI